MSNRIRIGVIGANSHHGWAGRTHIPAILASDDFELVGVCTTHQESAEESAKLYGAKLAFHDYHAMVEHPDIDAVSVVIRVPSHFPTTKAAIEAGKPVYTEWPLGRTTDEAVELADLARSKGVVTTVGLQGRTHPTITYMKDLIADGYVGDVMSCHLSFFHKAALKRPLIRSWQSDASMGANTLTIVNGHTLDVLTYIVGGLASLSAVVTTQNKQWLVTDTNEMIDVDSPDTVAVVGKLLGGGVITSHVAMTTHPGSGFRLEIYGSKGRLITTSPSFPQSNDHVLKGASGDQALEHMEVPARYFFAPAGTFVGAPDPTMPEHYANMPEHYATKIGQNYHEFARSIRHGDGTQPTFDDAVTLHKLLDCITHSSETGREVNV